MTESTDWHGSICSALYNVRSIGWLRLKEQGCCEWAAGCRLYSWTLCTVCEVSVK